MRTNQLQYVGLNGTDVYLLYNVGDFQCNENGLISFQITEQTIEVDRRGYERPRELRTNSEGTKIIMKSSAFEYKENMDQKSKN